MGNLMTPVQTQGDVLFFQPADSSEKPRLKKSQVENDLDRILRQSRGFGYGVVSIRSVRCKLRGMLVEVRVGTQVKKVLFFCVEVMKFVFDKFTFSFTSNTFSAVGIHEKDVFVDSLDGVGEAIKIG